jgi:hypothetical protein
MSSPWCLVFPLLNFLSSERFSCVRFVTRGHPNFVFSDLLKLFNNNKTEVQRFEVEKTLIPHNLGRNMTRGKRSSKDTQFCEGSNAP